MRNTITGVRRLAIFVLMGTALVGCQIEFVSAYDDVFDKQVSASQMDVDALMNKIAAKPAQPYASFATDYAKIETDFDAIELRAGISIQNSDTQHSVTKLRHTFDEFQSSHSNSAAPMNAEFTRRELTTLNTEFQILMAQEMAKKSGQKQAGT